MTEQERRWLICHALGISTAELLAHPERAEARPAQELLRRREAGEPLQYIMGEATFYGRDFRVGPGVLIPRLDTEVLIEAALSLLPDERRPFTFLDWGTGSGCVAATLLLERPGAFALGADRSPAALECARGNLERYHLEGRARLLATQTPEDIDARGLDLVVSNPPYIPSGEIAGLQREVRDYEPRLALDGGPDGLDAYRALLRRAPKWLRPGGLLLLEAGDESQSAAMRALPHEGLRFLREFRRGADLAIPPCVVWEYLG